MKLPKRLRIKVTAADIKKGVACEVGRCPIALAVKRSYDVTHVSVGVSTVCFQSGDAVGRYFLSPKAYQFVRDFDSGRKVKPATFLADEAADKREHS